MMAVRLVVMNLCSKVSSSAILSDRASPGCAVRHINHVVTVRESQRELRSRLRRSSALAFSTVFGTNEVTSTHSCSLPIGAFISEQWQLSPRGPRPSIKPPLCSLRTAKPRSRPASCHSLKRPWDPGCGTRLVTVPPRIEPTLTVSPTA